jgi:hypothetical protein
MWVALDNMMALNILPSDILSGHDGLALAEGDDNTFAT